MTTVKPVEILTTLDQEPNVNFFPWEMDVQDVAAGMAKSLHDQGLLSAILTDEQWDAHPGNSVVDHMDVRFFWLRDRVQKAQFSIKHLAGRWNISDFFTKPLPKEKFEQFVPYIVVTLDEARPKPTRKTMVMEKKV